MECSTIPARVIATCFALVAFAAAVALGWSVDNSTATIILHALLTMAICWFVGLAVGSVLQRVNERAIAAYKQRNPMTAESAKAPAAGAAPNPAANSDSVTTQPERNVSATPAA